MAFITNAIGIPPAIIVQTTGSYSDPSWIISLAGSKISGAVTTATNATNVGTTSTSSNAAYYLTFVSSSSSGNQALDIASGISFNPSTNILSTTGLNLSGLTASQLVATDSSQNLISLPNYGITALSTVTGSSQAMSLSTLYVNNYTSGQTAYTLPAATGSGKMIGLVSLTTASTSGWMVTANGTDKIQFMSSLSAAGGNLQATAGSSTDCATFRDVASGLWVVYPAAGLNLTVT